MIYSDHALLAWATGGGVAPFDTDSINPASIDLKLGNNFIDLPTGEKIIEDNSILVWRDSAILVTTLEYIKMPNNAAGAIYLKSSLARRGLDHALAGWVDPGFHGELTLELHAHQFIKLYVGQPIIQLVLIKTDGPVQKPYDGKYQGQRGPTEAQ